MSGMNSAQVVIDSEPMKKNDSIEKKGMKVLRTLESLIMEN